ncbi:MAG: hypothetical protein WC421_02785 [Elusimicrobiales bacterium]
MNETIKGKLPVGAKFDGATHRDFELRRELVSDTVEAMDNPRAQHNKAYLTVCVYARRLARLGTIPAGKITPELVMGLAEEDFDALVAASNRFRSGEKQQTAPDNTGADGAGV